MDQLESRLDQLNVDSAASLESLVSEMKKNKQHWVLWPGDEVPMFFQQEKKCNPADEVIFELYWKNGWASDIHEIRCREGYGVWWKHTAHKYIKVRNIIVGEALYLFDT